MMLDVFQNHLDAVSTALMEGDFESYMSRVAVPLVVMNEKSTVLISEKSDFRAAFDAYGVLLKSQHATHLMRLGHSVTQYAPGLITGHYETHVLRSGQRIFGPFQSTLVLRRHAENWKVASVVCAAFDDLWPPVAMAQHEREANRP